MVDAQALAAGYNQRFPKHPQLSADKGWVTGFWLMGFQYRGSGYWGGFPGNYLDRVLSMFARPRRGLHLFSGAIPPTPGWVRVDLAAAADVQADAHQLPFADGTFDLIVADPPYSAEAAARYGTPMINRRLVLRECARVLEKGGCLVWLDTVLPPWRKADFRLMGLIGLGTSQNRVVRATCIFERS